MKESWLISELNQLSESEFVGICGGFCEKSPWVAERAMRRRPFRNREELYSAMLDAISTASEAEKLALLNAHPDLVGGLTDSATLSQESCAEQSAAGLTALPSETIAAFAELNRRYRHKFGFPFILCARENKLETILAALPRRLENSQDVERASALREVGKIARLRLLDAVHDEYGQNPKGSPSMINISYSNYGKSQVRLTKVRRGSSQHELQEYCVQVLLEGDFLATYTQGDNRLVVPTDTMKNTVYALARTTEFETPEEFARLIVEHFLIRYPQVQGVRVDVEATLWERILVGGKPHPHAFQKRSELQTASARQDRSKRIDIQGGIEQLCLLKTSGSEFSNFHRDQWTTLQDTFERIFATIIRGCWDYVEDANHFAPIFPAIRQILIETFAGHHSLSVQQTLHEMAVRVLESEPSIQKISLTMPNQHRLLADLSRLGLDNPNEIFVTTSEPFGLIHATLER